MEFIHEGAIGKLKISEAELYVDNETRNRSGHMTHAMIEYAPGKVIAFNSNCSAVRFGGHSAFGWIEYRYSEDGGKSWSGIHDLPVSKEILMDGIYSISVEKAVFCNGVITLFAVRNTQANGICCEPWETPLVIQSYDLGKSWEKPYEFSPFKGRIYDAKVKDGIIYAAEACDKDFISERQDPRYRLFASRDNGKSFQEESIIRIPSYKRGYGSLQITEKGEFLFYACNLENSFYLEVGKSSDNGRTWTPLEPILLKYGLRNVQIAPLEGGYVMHGRACFNGGWGQGQVIYTSKDGIHWDDGILMETTKAGCYYSNMISLQDENGKGYVLLQYSDGYNGSRVNVMHRFLSLL